MLGGEKTSLLRKERRNFMFRSRLKFIVIAAVFLCVAFFLQFASITTTSGAQQRGRIMWEYTSVCLNDNKTPDAAVQKWNALGAEGWEMVAYGTAAMDGCSRFVFKRTK